MAEKVIDSSKFCIKCAEAKPASTEFFGKKRGALTARCRSCLRADDRKRNREDENRRLYQNKLKRLANPERAKAMDAASYRKNPDKKRRQAREWKKRNRERYNENLRNWHRRQRRDSSEYRLRKSVSALIYWHLKSGKGGKRTEEVLGYTIQELRCHLERQFFPRMSWDNYGEWHVDHIVPAASFNFESADDPQFRACWALANLRPLWAPDNVSKGSKRTHLI